MRFNSTATAGLLAAALGLAPAMLQAQVHAQGSCWIRRDAGHSTWLHPPGDSLCVLGFPPRCYRGMMWPDSVQCSFRHTPPESLPRGCAAGYQLHIRDPQGGCMIPGRMTFRFNLPITLHYDPDAVVARGIPLANLVLIRQASAGYEIVAEASHDPGTALFHLSTSMPSTWYGIADRSNLPVAVEEVPWWRMKRAYR